MHWGPLVVLAVALFIIIVDTTLLNVSLRAIIKDLNSNTQEIQWVITVYSLILAAFTITGGRLGDIFGRKRMFLVGAVIFAIGSLIAAFSTSFAMMLAGESIVEGFGAALMMPATASLLLLNYQGRERAIAFAVWGAMAGVAAAVGPILGGYLTTNYTWRYGFLINVFVVIGLLIFSRLIKDNPMKKENLTVDWGGVALSSVSLLVMVFGLIEASTYGWWSKKADFVVYGQTLQPGNLSITPVAVALGVIGLVLFYFWELRVTRSGRTPLLTLDLFKNKPFVAGVASLFAISMALTGFSFIMPVFYQAVLGFDAFHSGLANLPLSLALLVTAPLGAVLSKKILPKTLVIIGMALTAIAVYWVSLVFSIEATAATFALPLILFGAGMGFVQSQVNNLALSAVPISEAGEASGVANTSRQLASALGAALLGTILLAAIPTHIQQGVEESAVLPEQAKPTIAKQLEAAGNDIEFAEPQAATGSAQVSPVITSEIGHIIKSAITESDKSAAKFATIFVLIGVVVAFWLPKRPAEHKSDGVAVAGH